MRQQLDARSDGGSQVGRRRIRVILQHAIDAVAQVQAILEGLDMDIRGGHVHRPMNNLVDQADDRRLAGQVFQMLDELVVALPGELVRQFILITGLVLLQVKLQGFADI